MRVLHIFAILTSVACRAWVPPRQIASKSSALHVSKLQPDAAKPAIAKEQKTVDRFLYLLPPAISCAAFCLYTDTSRAFHNFIDTASGNTWATADGGKYMAEIVKPVLNGPVTYSISILLGTLVAMTIANLYQRQVAINKTIISTVEEVRGLLLIIDGFPEPYRSQGKLLLEKFLTERLDEIGSGTVTEDTIRKKEMAGMFRLLNKLSNEPQSPGFVGEAYGSLTRLKDIRSEFIGAVLTVFAPGHYFNIGILIFTLLFVFLLETDQSAMQFLLNFQLSICWALLIGAFSMLGVVIYDLATPFSGVFRVVIVDVDSLDLTMHVLALDDAESS